MFQNPGKPSDGVAAIVSFESCQQRLSHYDALTFFLAKPRKQGTDDPRVHLSAS